MKPTKEQFYLRQVAELEKRNAELLKEDAKLAEQVVKLSKTRRIPPNPLLPISADTFNSYGFF